MMRRLAIFTLLGAFVSGCYEQAIHQEVRLLGMKCEAVEIRTSAFLTLGALACETPQGAITNLVGGTGKAMIELPLQAVGMGTTIGSTIAIGRALKQVEAGTTIILPGE